MTSLQMWDNDLMPGTYSAVMPCQVEESVRDTPEKALLRAVFDDAIICLKRNLAKAHKSFRHRRLLEEGILWLTDPREDEITTFVALCRVFALEPRVAREGILNQLAASLTTSQPGALRRCYMVNTRAGDPDKAHGSAWKERKRAEHGLRTPSESPVQTGDKRGRAATSRSAA